MASGTPVLAEANPMMEELIEPGVNGALWRGDPESLGRVTAELLNTPERLRKWGEQARERLQPTYLQGHCLDALERLLLSPSRPFLTQHRHKLLDKHPRHGVRITNG